MGQSRVDIPRPLELKLVGHGSDGFQPSPAVRWREDVTRGLLLDERFQPRDSKRLRLALPDNPDLSWRAADWYDDDHSACVTCDGHNVHAFGPNKSIANQTRGQ
eukprot:TRINITY_DN12423_c0_g1_i5.p3 TRINITY_DN12423_c0_g1~~TRINITY_DN12423_c0_g1_i5.p3  ORF type:complete len:104 (-),score=5.93 TRINITY_DN12423_c0_g1_i5:477-788(-)